MRVLPGGDGGEGSDKVWTIGVWAGEVKQDMTLQVYEEQPDRKMILVEDEV